MYKQSSRLDPPYALKAGPRQENEKKEKHDACHDDHWQSRPPAFPAEVDNAPRQADVRKKQCDKNVVPTDLVFLARLRWFSSFLDSLRLKVERCGNKQPNDRQPQGPSIGDTDATTQDSVRRNGDMATTQDSVLCKTENNVWHKTQNRENEDYAQSDLAVALHVPKVVVPDLGEISQRQLRKVIEAHDKEDE
jgi:hypothetical protein